MSKNIIILCIIFIIIMAIFEISLMVTYGNKPTGEVPFWVTYFLLND